MLRRKVELLELIVSALDLLELGAYVCRGVWWVIRAIAALVIGIGRAAWWVMAAVGRGVARAIGRLRARHALPRARVHRERGDYWQRVASSSVPAVATQVARSFDSQPTHLETQVRIGRL
jgi:hypothetical protein